MQTNLTVSVSENFRYICKIMFAYLYTIVWVSEIC